MIFQMPSIISFNPELSITFKMRTTEFIKIAMSKHEMLYEGFRVDAGKGTNGTHSFILLCLQMLQQMAAVIVFTTTFEMSWT